MEKLDETDTFIDAEALGNIRKSADWVRACAALDLRFCKRRSKDQDWWGHSPFGEDRTPSFHVMPEKGVWYCFSTKQGGGIIELVQALKAMNCFEAGQWLLDQGLCRHSAHRMEILNAHIAAFGISKRRLRRHNKMHPTN